MDEIQKKTSDEMPINNIYIRDDEDSDKEQ